MKEGINMFENIVSSVASAIAKVFPFECMDATFMQYALLALLLIAPLVAVTGVQVVNSRMAFFSDAIGHSAFAGVALGLVFSISPDISMPLLALAVGGAIMYLRRSSALSSDTVIGVVFSAIVAFGLAVVSARRDLGSNMKLFLVGDILTVDSSGIVALFILLCVFAVFEFFAYNRLLAISVNPQLASVHRIPVAVYQYFFTLLLSLVVIYSVRAVGVLLVTALLIVPAASARNFASSSKGMFYYALAFSYISVVAGLLISAQDYASTPAGATIVLVSCGIFLASMIYSRFRPDKTADCEK